MVPPVGAVPAKLSVSGVSKTFPGKKGRIIALDHVTLDVEEGEFICLVGPSGCGKTTLLNLIAGLEMPDSGQVMFDGKPVAGPGSDRMVMFQESALFPWLDVMANVMFGLKLRAGLDASARRGHAHYYLKMVGLERFRHSAIHQLSGGMKQRVALARALAPEPRVLLMDEPFASLDALTREQFYGDFQRIQQQRRRTVVLVTHNVREAACLGDRVVLLSAHPGRIREEFRIPIPRPRDISSVEVAREAQKMMAVLKGHLAEDTGRGSGTGTGSGGEGDGDGGSEGGSGDDRQVGDDEGSGAWKL
jgi:NitT/TauT family transport system ATP-binding protein